VARILPRVPQSIEVGELTQRTERGDVLLTMARMADRMISMGRHEAAARLLADHLRAAVAKARDGAEIPTVVRETVGIYGLKLTEVTQDPTWANLAVELHVLLRVPPPERAVGALEQAVARFPLDRPLLLRLKAALRDAAEGLSREDLALTERILKIPTR
jgi:hypothetical protein